MLRILALFVHLITGVSLMPRVVDEFSNFDHCYSECIQRYYARGRIELVLCIAGCAVGQPPPGCSMKGRCLPYKSEYGPPIYGGYSRLKHPSFGT